MRYAFALLCLPLVACDGKPSKPASAPPAHAETIAHETELLRITLTPEAQRRIGLATERVASATAAPARQVAGEIVVPPVTASGIPTGSITDLRLIGAQQAAADGQVAQAAAQVRLARIALTRADALVREEAGSIRVRDEATAALATAQAALTAARQQRALLGPSVSAMGEQVRPWVRVSVFASDIAAIRRGEPATIRPIGDGSAARVARAMQAPPSANSVAGTIDLFYAIDNHDRAYRVGQRVAVDLPLAGQVEGLSVPASAIVRDIHGGEWVYRRTAKDQFVRQRVEVASEAGGRALLARGLTPDAEVVTVGAAELFGTEFGAAH